MSLRYFVPEPPAPGLLTLGGPEAHHLVHVSRHKVGDTVVLFCGDGRDYPATISHLHKGKVELLVKDGVAVNRELPYFIWLAAPLPQAQRADFLIEKLVELGCTRFTPLATERSVVSLSANKTEKLRRAVIEASKQCGRNHLMVVTEPLKLAAFLTLAELPPARFVADPLGATRGELGRENSVFLVGPEGGLTAAELVAAQGAGFVSIGLGPRILRVETAALALLARAGSIEEERPPANR